MKKALVSMSVATLLAASSIPAQAQENLIYVPVSPCRIVDTRPSSGGEGAISAGNFRNFLVSGTVTDQGGTADGCPAPRPGSEPLAISAYVVAVPLSGSTSGVLTAYPSDQSPPAAGEGATVNFAAGQVIGNTTNITLCEPDTCPTIGDTGEFAVLARSSIQHVIIDVQGYFYPATGSCPDDMVASGSICIDKYEASVWDAPSGGSQIDPSTSCALDGSDCSKDSTAGTGTPIYAQSVVGVTPTAQVTWYQAAQACANVGKRLPTTAEWQAAASGTVDPGLNTDPAAGCNTASASGVSLTGASGDLCKSDAGAFDMIGNLWEWTAELAPASDGSGFTFTTTTGSIARALGTDFNSDAGGGVDTSTQALLLMEPGTSGSSRGPITSVASLGFRCVR